MKKIASLLTFVLVLALAVPAFAADLDATSTAKVENDGEETTTTLTYIDGTLTLVDADDVTANTGLFAETVLDDETTVELKPELKYTGVENLTAGLEGTMGDDDDKAVIYKKDAETTDVSVKTYANYEIADAVEGLTVGAENDVTMTKKDSDDTDETTATVKPYANYETTVAEGLTVGADNSFEYVTIDGDKQELVIDPYANYETTVAEGVTAGVESDVEFKQDYAVEDSEMGQIATVNPYVNVDQTLAEGLTFTTDANYEVKAMDKDAKTLNVTPTVKYTAIPNVTAGVKGIDDEIADDESYMIQKKDENDYTDIAAKVYADLEVEAAEGLTVGSNNNVTAKKLDGADSFNEELTVEPFANYTTDLTDNVTFTSENSYEVKVLNKDMDTEKTLSVMGKVDYTF